VLDPGPPPVIAQAPGSLPPIPRDNPFFQPFNVSVPGITVAQALTLRPSLTPTPDPVARLGTIVLGFPSLFLDLKPTQIELAKFLHPTTVIEWLGALTPIDTFTARYGQVLDELSKTHATLITANIPDVTEIPFFTSAQRIADHAHLPIEVVTSMLGIGAGDYVRITAREYVDGILTNKIPGPLQHDCKSPLTMRC